MNRIQQQEALWWTWRNKKNTENLGKLIDAFTPMMKSHINSLGNRTLPSSALEAEAALQAQRAFESFDPGRGVALSTHVGSQLRKVNRFVYDNQSVGRLPEGQILRTGQYRNAYDTLLEKKGRDPTTEELARTLGWSQGMVARTRRGLTGEVAMSSHPLFEELNPDVGHRIDAQTILKYVYTDLTPAQKLVFEHTFGYGGRKALKTNREIATRLRLSEAQVRQHKQEIDRMISAFQRRSQ